ncbi:MAG: hypothetical protein K8T26_17050 [Lentisphaerae bacterium]|nr:hypothetical protein [Lentisphaerota bacterium]
MIWNPYHPDLRSLTPPVVDLVDELGALCGQTLSGDGRQLEEVVLAVTATLESEPGDSPPDPKVVVTLASKALWAIGETRAARRLGLLATGMMRQAEWNVAGDAPMWVLDVQPLAKDPGNVLEMQLIGHLDLILDCMSDVWDDADGGGVLGLLHLDAFRRPGRRHGGRPAWADEIMSACGTRLAAIGRRRGWARKPAVIALDLHG